MTAPVPVYRMNDTCMGQFTIWPIATFKFGRHPAEALIEVTLGNGDDSWNRLRPEELPLLADQLETFAAELRKYHTQLTTQEVPDVTPR